MAKVHVTLSNVLAEAAGTKKLELEVKTLRDALKTLIATRNGLSGQLATNEGEPYEHINVFVDGRDYRFVGGLDTSLSDGAVLTVVPAVSGG